MWQQLQLNNAPFVVAENRAEHRFELRDGVSTLLSFADFVERGVDVVVPHVETVRQHRGNGHAARLVDGMLDQLRASGRTITPLCSFAAGHIAENAQYSDLVTR
jgi:predicted GNAT family acetyltransferase